MVFYVTSAIFQPFAMRSRRDKSFRSPRSHRMFRRHNTRSQQRCNNRYSIHRLKHDLRRTLWHAFDSLKSPNGSVHKSQLKVLASSIGRELGVEKCEEYLDKNETVDLDFVDFFAILEEKLLEPLARTPTETNQLGETDYEKVHHVCWTLCSSKRMSRRFPDLTKPLTDDVLYKLWRLFNFLVEVDDLYVPLLPLRIHREEVQQIVRSFFTASGLMHTDSVVDSIGKDRETYLYPDYQELFEINITKDLSDNVLQYAIKAVYDEYINDTLMKGMVCKRGHQVKTWKDRWMVLTAGELKYYTSQDQRDLKGCITFDHDCRVEILPEQAGHKPNRFVVHTASKPYEMSASDVMTRNEWISAVSSVIDHSEDDSYHFHQNDFIKRRERREQQRKEREKEERLKQEEAENLRRMQQEFDNKHKQDAQLLEEQLRELEREKREREALEAKLKEEAALRELDQQRLRELEAMKAELERLLEEERQAKKDEEIVRSLQARILEEETQKREELERLKEQQEELLKMERQKREGLEGQKEEQESLLQQAKDRLEQLEVERMKADEKLEEAHSKLQDAEKERIKLQDKVKLWKTPIGLARPILPKVDPHVTHRGKGAFCDADFKKQEDKPNGIESVNKCADQGDLSESQTNVEKKESSTKEHVSIGKVLAELPHDRNTEHTEDNQISRMAIIQTEKEDQTENKDENKKADQTENEEKTEKADQTENGEENIETVQRHSSSNQTEETSNKNKNHTYENQEVIDGVFVSCADNNEHTKHQSDEIDVPPGDENSKNVVENESETGVADPIYANEDSESMDDLSENKPDVMGFDNMIYESVELKVIEPGD